MDPLLLELAAFLNMIVQGHFPSSEQSKKEAEALLEKIGDELSKEDDET